MIVKKKGLKTPTWNYKDDFYPNSLKCTKIFAKLSAAKVLTVKMNNFVMKFYLLIFCYFINLLSNFLNIHMFHSLSFFCIITLIR